MTAPGPRIGEMIGMLQKMLIASRPGRLPASGSTTLASASPRPVSDVAAGTTVIGIEA